MTSSIQGSSFAGLRFDTSRFESQSLSARIAPSESLRRSEESRSDYGGSVGLVLEKSRFSARVNLLVQVNSETRIGAGHPEKKHAILGESDQKKSG